MTNWRTCDFTVTVLLIISLIGDIIFHISFCLSRDLTSNKSTHCLIDYDNRLRSITVNNKFVEMSILRSFQIIGLCSSTMWKILCKHLHAYIHNWLLQPFSQDYGLASHATNAVCVNFIGDWRDLQFKTDFWEIFSWQVYLFAEFLPEICWEEIAEKNICYLVLMPALGYEPEL